MKTNLNKLLGLPIYQTKAYRKKLKKQKKQSVWQYLYSLLF